ncbi:MAG TPA: PKD domain-containing protein [Chitinophagaceae bacterium]
MKPLTLTASFVLCALFAFSQSTTCPPNIDFENGNFSNWECLIGNTVVVNGQNVINLTPSPPVGGRHEIIDSTRNPGLDFYGKFPILCPYGGRYSVKLGNEQTNANAEGLSYTFQVPTTIDTFTFTYFYAVVFEDPSHSMPEQPRFFVTAYDVATGEVVNCASFDYVSNGAIPGFEVSTIRPNVLFKRWSPASLQFAGMSGRMVRLEFKTADCTLGGHFGYAYVDVGSACSNILATAPYCQETNSLILNAPYGFKNYTWYNQDFTAVLGTQQSLTLSPPPSTSGVFNVDVDPYPGYGCRDTLQAVVNPLPVPDTPVAESEFVYCQFATANQLTATAKPGCELLWYTTPTGGTGATIPPTPSTAVNGVFEYYVSQKVLFGCESFRKKITVIVTPTPLTSFNVNTARQCLNGNQYIFTSTSTNLNNHSFRWDFGDGLGTSTDSIATYTYPNSGNFTVKLKVLNEGACTSEKSFPVTIVPKPVANFNFPSVICEQQTLVSLTDRSMVPGGGDIINGWWWNLDGSIVQTQNPPSFTPGRPGPFAVKQVVTTSEGCRSDTNTVVLNIRYKPVIAFRFGDLLCDNEIIQFTDLSYIPPAATSESIVKWQWLIDNNIISGMQHPPMVLASGPHDVRLIAESNFGCRNEGDGAFTVYTKPQLQLTINDSCVFRTIRYTASDLTNATVQWNWDLGYGLFKDDPLITRSYNREGPRPLTVIGHTIKGCKDTLFRPFRIYDNKAFAGRDTVVAKGEPVQLNAKGGKDVLYNWSPSTGLNNSEIENPVATLDRDQLYYLDAVTKEGCDSHSQIYIKRYAGPDIYIPNAFTPNRDGKNDVFHVVPIGIRTFHYLAIYNRYGELVFRSTDQHKGWDGTYKGAQLSAGTFVAVSQAIDYKGNVMLRKRTVVLIR